MFIIVTKYLIPNGYSGLTVFPFILLGDPKSKSHKPLINHEKIHIQQQLELLLLPFFIWYLMEYLLRLLQYGTHFKAYRNISFEREAYANESNLAYLDKRNYFGFLKYIKEK